MKKLLLYIGAGILLLSACHDLNLNPLSSGSTENWYSTETEVQMAVDELYRYDFWPEDGQQQTDWSDDYTSRDLLTSFDDGTLNGQNAWVTSLWGNQYKAISRANAVIEIASCYRKWRICHCDNATVAQRPNSIELPLMPNWCKVR